MNHVQVSAHITVNSFLSEISIFIYGYNLDGVYICSPNKQEQLQLLLQLLL
jgi:hypothetical protein